MGVWACVRVGVRACVRVGVRACGRACGRACVYTSVGRSRIAVKGSRIVRRGG